MRQAALLIPRSGEGDASLQPVVKTMLKQIFPLQPTEVHGEAGIYPAACPNARAGGRIRKVAVACIEPMPQQITVRNCDL